MSSFLILDSRPVNDLCFSDKNPRKVEALSEALARGAEIIIPDVVRYEKLRGYEFWRDLAPVQAQRAIDALDMYCSLARMTVSTTDVLDHAARLWAAAKRQGVRTAGDSSIDIDVIIAAHVDLLAQNNPDDEAVVLTSNARHFRLLGIEARDWDRFAQSQRP